MANPKVQNTRFQVDPSLTDVFNLQKRDIFLSLKCHDIATVQEFDSEKQTITATINYKRTYSQKGPNGKYIDVLVDYPILLDVPVIFLGNKNRGLTFPVSKGDVCLILYNDRDIDNWFQSGQIAGVASSRAHSISDGIAIIGLYSSNNSIEDFDEDRVLLRNNDVEVGLSESKVRIKNATRNLYTVLNQLISDLQSATTIPAAIGVPLTFSPGTIAALAADAAALGELLE